MKRAVLLAAVYIATAQCTDVNGPRPLDNSIGVIVSGLVAPQPGSAAAQPSPSGVATGFAYVSLPPSSVPDGIRATVTNHATGVVVNTVMQNGGFDPVAIGANVGDTLAVDITTNSSGVVDHALLVVAARRPPRIVRTNPPSGGRDVPLNSTMVVVFSEPIDPATLTPGVGLRLGDTVSVSGDVAFADPLQVSVAFQPSAQLAPLTTYQLVVTQAVRDVSGLALDSMVRVSFTTGAVAVQQSSCRTPTSLKAVLVDASHDGGVWWFPQAGPFASDQPHQGQALADTLRAQGYVVDEMGRGDPISEDRLLAYQIVIRAGNYGGYTSGELNAYDAFAACPRTLLLLGEFLRTGVHDDLADNLGIALTGWVDGSISDLAPGPITAGVTTVPFIAGSFVDTAHSASVQLLGWLGNGGQPVMGILQGHPAKVFFIGDTNGLETVPQPLVNNLVSWGF